MIALIGMTMIADERLMSVTSKFEFEMTAEQQNEIPQMSTTSSTTILVLAKLSIEIAP